jgi:hypothetical protein
LPRFQAFREGELSLSQKPDGLQQMWLGEAVGWHLLKFFNGTTQASVKLIELL